MREEAEQLREQLAAVELDRRELIERLKVERGRSGDAAARVDDLRNHLRARDETIVHLESQLGALGVTPEERFVIDVEQASGRSDPPADRERYPWRPPIIGPDFLESLETVEGIARSPSS